MSIIIYLVKVIFTRPIIMALHTDVLMDIEKLLLFWIIEVDLNLSIY